MTYSELLKCDELEIREFHMRVGCMLRVEFGETVANQWSLAKPGFYKKASHQRVAWDLYTLSRGKTLYSWSGNKRYKANLTEFKTFELRFKFESLVELSLKLTAMGY